MDLKDIKTQELVKKYNFKLYCTKIINYFYIFAFPT